VFHQLSWPQNRAGVRYQSLFWFHQPSIGVLTGRRSSTAAVSFQFHGHIRSLEVKVNRGSWQVACQPRLLRFSPRIDGQKTLKVAEDELPALDEARSAYLCCIDFGKTLAPVREVAFLSRLARLKISCLALRQATGSTGI
jgi:hypothetical protein